MDHVAILRKSKIKKGDNLLADILSGEKTIESRWYKHKIVPWNSINVGDTVYFKESGEPVTAKSSVIEVLQFSNLNDSLVSTIIYKYGKAIDPHVSAEDFLKWWSVQNSKNYCILIFLSNVQRVEKPFGINKSGFGSSCAWLVVKDITLVKIDRS